MHKVGVPGLLPLNYTKVNHLFCFKYTVWSWLPSQMVRLTNKGYEGMKLRPIPDLQFLVVHPVAPVVVCSHMEEECA